jgi:hypothetical protein
MYKAIGNTYAASEFLARAGFVRHGKEWTTDSQAVVDKFAAYARPAMGVKANSAVRAVRIEQI